MFPATSTRLQLAALVSAHPGTRTRGLAEQLGLNETTVGYHLDRLEREGIVFSERVGRERCWYAPECRSCPVLRRAFALVQRPAFAQVIGALDDAPRTARELAERAGVSVGATRWVVGELTRAGLVARTPMGRVARREGAEVCFGKARAGEPCGLWGACAVSRARQAPTSSPSPFATGSSLDRSSGPRRAPSSG